MLLFTLCFLLGDCFLQLFPALPDISSIAIIVTAALFLTLCIRTCILLAFAAGFCYAWWIAYSVFSYPLITADKPQILTGYVASLPVAGKFGTQFLFHLDRSPVNVSLTSDNSQRFRVGDKWQLLVKLKPVHGNRSPGAFDYEAWALQNKIRAQGKITASESNKCLGSAWWHYPVQRLRAGIRDRIKQFTNDPWLLALMIGERHGLDVNDWQILRDTGTNHLLAIAGLHIGILFLFTQRLIKTICLRFPRLLLRIPANDAAAAIGLIVAMFYSAVAGFSLPTQRACIMLAVYIMTNLCRHEINQWYVWATALLIILLLNPLTVLSPSLWLSAGTIAIIIYGAGGRVAPAGLWWRHGRVQLLIAIGLLPLSLLFFSELSFVSFIANCIAIPWMGVLMPLCLLSLLCIYLNSFLAHALLWLNTRLVLALKYCLLFLANLPVATMHQALSVYWQLAIAVFAILLLLAPRGVPGKLLAVLWFIPVFGFVPPRPEIGSFRLTILDVGQGLSTVVTTQHHTLLYDTGPASFTGRNAGDDIVLPYLLQQAIHRIDVMVVSHGDNDHIGGAQAVIKNITLAKILTSVPAKLPTPYTELCRQGMNWKWDEVSFEFLYPRRKVVKNGNDSSCVLRITTKNQTILLPGDIESAAEKYLLRHQKNKLTANIIVAPHHGSKTSIAPGFVPAVKPDYVVYTTGFMNRYHFPHPTVIKAYANSMQLNIAETGTITFDLRDNNVVLDCYAHSHRHYWWYPLNNYV